MILYSLSLHPLCLSTAHNSLVYTLILQCSIHVNSAHVCTYTFNWCAHTYILCNAAVTDSGTLLPKGWQRMTDEQKKTYYWHIPTGQTQYTKPTGENVEGLVGPRNAHVHICIYVIHKAHYVYVCLFTLFHTYSVTLFLLSLHVSSFLSLVSPSRFLPYILHVQLFFIILAVFKT